MIVKISDICVYGRLNGRRGGHRSGGDKLFEVRTRGERRHFEVRRRELCEKVRVPLGRLLLSASVHTVEHFHPSTQLGTLPEPRRGHAALDQAVDRVHSYHRLDRIVLIALRLHFAWFLAERCVRPLLKVLQLWRTQLQP